MKIKQECNIMYPPIKEEYEAAVARAKKNLQDEDLEKCLKALKAYMRNVKG